ncbi:zinc-binding dehydrogenase [uncultured Veillonella sp.]|uniref:zinc-binding dehydrogenase n=1 Tax=uncultured Veillonella sp. TaxID=159268 RepID=UPI0025DB683E|nr:zinc-binding dehydrogenase [uncultured Veillonella sp.]
MPYRYYAAWRHQVYEFISVKPGRQDLEYMLEVIQEIGYKPSIDSIYSLEEGEKALRYVNVGGLKGKVLLKIQ